ncbi:MAG: Sec-independent protein translocase subunit TatA/TatB [Planctomycetota bacterium]|jgi:sec-independent protein translocase protein TatA
MTTPTLLAFLGLQEGALIIVAIIIFFLFGAKKLPQLARSTGQSVGEFKKGLKEGVEEEDNGSGGNSGADPSRN